MVFVVIFGIFFREDIMKQKIPLCPKCPTPDLQVNYFSFLNKKLNFNIFTSNILFPNRLLKIIFLANVSPIKWVFFWQEFEIVLRSIKMLKFVFKFILKARKL